MICELLPATQGIAELCCGDCAAQWAIYREALPGLTFCGLDVAPAIVAANRAAGVPCILGDTLDPDVLRPFLAYDIIFFGPPLSAGCDGHHALAFAAVQPGFAAFTDLFLGRLGYAGTLVCIGPKTTHLGDIRRLYDRIRAQRADVGLRLIHSSHATPGRPLDDPPGRARPTQWAGAYRLRKRRPELSQAEALRIVRSAH